MKPSESLDLARGKFPWGKWETRDVTGGFGEDNGWGLALVPHAEILCFPDDSTDEIMAVVERCIATWMLAVQR